MSTAVLTPGQIAYRQYLQTEHWRELRLAAFKRWGKKCFQCARKLIRLDVHHLRYRYPWTSCTVDDVRPCCRDCHDKAHSPKIESSAPILGISFYEKYLIQKLSRTQRKRLARVKKRQRRESRRRQRINQKIEHITRTIQRETPRYRPKWTNRGSSSN